MAVVHSAEERKKILNKYSIKGKYLLAVGTLEPRKNIKRVIEAYKILNISIS